jgi:hypothetical protein
MTLNYFKVWQTMNDLETVTSKVCSAREILDYALMALENHKYDKTETLLHAVDEFLEYYLKEFDEKFKDAWQETVVKIKEEDPCMPPWGHSDLEYLAKQLPEEKPIQYGDKFYTYDEAIAAGCAGWEMTADGSWVPPQEKKDKVLKWRLPVEMDPCGEYFITFPDDLLEQTGWNEGDELIWEDNGDGSFTITKSN